MKLHVPCEPPTYEPPDPLVVEKTLKAIDHLLTHCSIDAVDNTCAGLLHYINARWDALRAEREICGEAWCQEPSRIAELCQGGQYVES